MVDLTAYLQGWATGDGDAILAAASPSYVLHDPAVGEITRDNFAHYMTECHALVTELRSGKEQTSYIETSELLREEVGSTTTASCWWTIAGTPLEGAALVKADHDGVRSHRVTYFAAPAQETATK